MAHLQEAQPVSSSQAACGGGGHDSDSDSVSDSDVVVELKVLKCSVCNHTASSHMKLLRHLQDAHRGIAEAQQQARELEEQR